MQLKCELGAGDCGGDDTTGNGGGGDADLDDAGQNDGPPPCPLTDPDCKIETEAPTGNSTQGSNDELDGEDNPEPAAENPDCQRNMATGECIPDTSSPTHPFPSSTPTEAPTVTPVPSVSAAPTIQDRTKCPLTGCVDEQDTDTKCPLTGCVAEDSETGDYPKLPVQKIPSSSFNKVSVLSGKRGGSGGMGMGVSRAAGKKKRLVDEGDGERRRLVKGVTL